MLLGGFSCVLFSAEVSDKQGASLENALVDYVERAVQNRAFQPITPVITHHMRDVFDNLYQHFIPGWLFFVRRATKETNNLQVWYRVKNFDEAKKLNYLIDSDTTLQVFKMIDTNFCH